MDLEMEKWEIANENFSSPNSLHSMLLAERRFMRLGTIHLVRGHEYLRICRCTPLESSIFLYYFNRPVYKYSSILLHVTSTQTCKLELDIDIFRIFTTLKCFILMPNDCWKLFAQRFFFLTKQSERYSFISLNGIGTVLNKNIINRTK